VLAAGPARGSGTELAKAGAPVTTRIPYREDAPVVGA